ncbi:unnamed protein product [Microthlaspi erraticum]|uniref:nicotinate phosphoribosyltransferase n=1 Tax=Microthlaspi erraticum TaxID=1685480 RepID=A0A6D2KD07_9BRAS|nr:unnamed protein product [Microthlaspi erraticum]
MVLMGRNRVGSSTDPPTRWLRRLYQFTMAYAYWKSGKQSERSVFDLYFRKNPFGGEYTIYAGLEECIKFLANFNLTHEEIDFVRDSLPGCEEAFCDYLRGLDCSDIEVHRFVTGKSKLLLEFGARRAQGPDGAINASKYCYLGGFDATSRKIVWNSPPRYTLACICQLFHVGATISKEPYCSTSYRRTPRFEISGTFRWAPFLALQKENSFLTMLLLLSKHKMKSIPVVDLGEAKIESIITQSGVIHMFAECAGLHWFEDWGIKTLSEVRLPIMSKDHIIKIYEDEPVLQVFKLMRRKRIGGIHVVERKSEKPLGEGRQKDLQLLEKIIDKGLKQKLVHITASRDKIFEEQKVLHPFV